MGLVPVSGVSALSSLPDEPFQFGARKPPRNRAQKGLCAGGERIEPVDWRVP